MAGAVASDQASAVAAAVASVVLGVGSGAVLALAALRVIG